MECFVGIDLGTSSVRAVAVDPAGRTLAEGQCEYDIRKPGLNQAEQDMEQLWQATVRAIGKMLDVHETIREGILGIGFSGQMHAGDDRQKRKPNQKCDYLGRPAKCRTD